MRTILHKFFWAWDFEKEEAWLNEKASQGMALVSVGWCRYEFEDCVPGQFQVRIELLEYGVNHPETRRYLQFLEDAGIQQAGFFRRWVYLRKRTEDGPFDLYSDLDSRLRHLSRLISLILVLTMPNLYNGGFNLFLYFQHGMAANLAGALICFAMAGLLLTGAGKLYRKKRRLRREQDIFE